MKLKLGKILSVFAVSYLFTSQAQAWNGPICFPDVDQEITITVGTFSGEKPGDVQVTFQDNDGELKLISTAPSTARAKAHDIVLNHKAGSSGIVGVKLSSLKYPTDGYVYEFEFRQTGDCDGANIIGHPTY